MSSSIQLIVGLANPGKEYAKTRHNAGAWFLEKLAEIAHANFRFDAKYHGFHTQIKLHDAVCHLLIPSTFMNHSGQAVQAIMNFYKINADQLLIVHDEIDLPAGAIRLKFAGGSGGHNGLKDIISHLGTQQFYRLRIGVGRPAHSHEVHDYVLHPPSKSERIEIETAIDKAENALPLILAGQFDKAMQKIHTETSHGT